MAIEAPAPRRQHYRSIGTRSSHRGGSAQPPEPKPLGYKPWLDRALALVLLVPAAPLIALLVLLVRLTSPGPGIYRQVRVGLRGRHFTMYKIRSMRCDAEAGTGAVWAQKSDPRVTRIGYLLRRFHLDELPQLWNVLKGEMSLVGPRPERPEFVERLVEQVPGYLDRLAVAPGVTGLAQINLPPDLVIDDVRRKLVLDCEYVEQATALLDLRIILCTFLRVVGLRVEAARKLLGLNRKVVLEDAAEEPILIEAIIRGAVGSPAMLAMQQE